MSAADQKSKGQSISIGTVCYEQKHPYIHFGDSHVYGCFFFGKDEPMLVLCIIVTLAACTIGNICGMGGGVLIKPVLDMLGIFSVATINWLSGCTVLCMSAWSVGRVWLRGESVIEKKTSTAMAAGAALGGLSGKALFCAVSAACSNPEMAGGVQAILLFTATALTLLYTRNKDRLPSYHLYRVPTCILAGFALGNLGSFLGIGGGPFNVALLCFLFSMSTKKAAQNSLYIIVFSQGLAILKQCGTGTVPDFPPFLLICMVVCAILGSELGRTINKKLSEQGAARLLEGAIILVMLICVFNIRRFFW